MKKVAHTPPKVKAIRKDDGTPQTRREEELAGLDTRIALNPSLDSNRIRCRGRRIATGSDPSDG